MPTSVPSHRIHSSAIEYLVAAANSTGRSRLDRAGGLSAEETAGGADGAAGADGAGLGVATGSASAAEPCFLALLYSAVRLIPSSQTRDGSGMARGRHVPDQLLCLVNKSAGKFQLFPGLRFHTRLDPESGGETLDPGVRRDDDLSRHSGESLNPCAVRYRTVSS